jgi:hypothetical protein
MQNTNLEIALKYAALAWWIFPCYWNEGHKPLVKWKSKSSDCDVVLEKWAKMYPNCYFCVACLQSGITVLDIDTKHNKGGMSTLFDLELEHGALPKTLTVKTPSGGCHYIFKGAAPFTIEKLGRGIDTPVMVPLPGSIVNGKGEYKTICGGETSIPILPEWVSQKLGEVQRKQKDREIPLVDLDLPHNIESARNYLMMEAPQAIEGEGGDLTTFQVACKVRDFGVSEAVCLELMAENWNDACEPHWSLEDLQKKVKNAYDHAQDRAGKNTPEADFDVIPSESPTEPTSAPTDYVTPIKFSEFVGAPPSREWLIEGILPKGEISLIYGDGGLGKSLLAMQLGAQLASGGGEFLGFKIKESVKVLMISCEDDKDEAHRRIYNIKRAPEYEFLRNDIPFFISPRVGESSLLGVQDGNIVTPGPFFKTLVEMVKDVGKGEHVLLVPDTLADIFAVNENDRQIANFCMKTLLGKFVKDFNCTVLTVAHPSKTSQKNKIYDSGSTGWRNAARNVLALTPHDNKNLKDNRVLHQTKSNYSRCIDPLVLRWEKGRFITENTEDIVDEVKDKNIETLLGVIAEMCQKDVPTPLGLHHNSKPNLYQVDIKDAAGGMMSKDTKKKIINELIKDGIVINSREDKRAKGLWPDVLIKMEG